VIFRAVFVVKIAIIEKEMYSHKLSAMADNYPADWCINLGSRLMGGVQKWSDGVCLFVWIFGTRT